MKKIFILLLSCFFSLGVQAQLKPRVVILTDIGRSDLEPDDTESLVHQLCYADMQEIEGIITSTGWNCAPYPTESATYRDSVVRTLKQEQGKQKIGHRRFPSSNSASLEWFKTQME